jgi:anaerobic magnesium-protoporphyrin IX monomethyl ester cyclase
LHDLGRNNKETSMNIFFIFPAINLSAWVNYGIAALCGIAKEKGHHVELYQPIKINIGELYNRFNNKKFSLCLVSATTNQYPYALKLIKHIKMISDVPVIIGGPHATSCPNILEENKVIDGLCIGEGDFALSELLDCFEKNEEPYHIKNMWFRNGDEVIKNEVRQLIQDLDSLPMPDYSVFSTEAINRRPSILLSRGCPYNCNYCCNNVLLSLYRGKGKYTRLKTIKRAIDEVYDFIRNYSPKNLNFDDDTFVKNKDWLSAFLEEYKNITKIPFNCNTRPETLDDEICRRLKDANCDTLCIGIESGNEEIRKNRFNRNMSNETIKAAFALAHKYKINTYAFNMVGIPGETYENHLDTMKLNREIKPTMAQITIFYPYPGTELYKYAKEKGYIKDVVQYKDSFTSRSILKMKQFPKWKISMAYYLFLYNVYSDNKSLFKRIKYIGAQMFSNNNYIRVFYNVSRNIFKKSLR